MSSIKTQVFLVILLINIGYLMRSFFRALFALSVSTITYGQTGICFDNSMTNYSHVFGQSTISSLVSSDINNDGKPDILYTNLSYGLFGLINLGNDSFANINYSSIAAQKLAVGDVNNDGKPDAITAKSGLAKCYINNGSGGFLTPTSYTIGSNSWDIVLADIEK